MRKQEKNKVKKRIMNYISCKIFSEQYSKTIVSRWFEQFEKMKKILVSVEHSNNSDHNRECDLRSSFAFDLNNNRHRCKPNSKQVQFNSINFNLKKYF